MTARDRTCRFPTCERPAYLCELDHQRPWSAGGHTNAGNLSALSPRHHHGKHETGWSYERLPDGSSRWTSPTGHVYDKPPATYPIDRTRQPAQTDGLTDTSNEPIEGTEPIEATEATEPTEPTDTTDTTEPTADPDPPPPF